jgi:hypothetical protein
MIRAEARVLRQLAVGVIALAVTSTQSLGSRSKHTELDPPDREQTGLSESRHAIKEAADQHQHGSSTDEMRRDQHGGAHEHQGHASMSSISGGPYSSLNAIGSGTSLLPSSSPANMWHWQMADWLLMLHGDLKAGFDNQGGPRGVGKAESQNWLMLMAERDVGDGARLLLRGMFSAEPATAPKPGFPELFQTGESYHGRPIIDAQHPHDLFMELAAALTIPLANRVSISLYGGPVGEPALGPVAFMHRPSAAENPAAPLGHHWQDSTHISHGVFTAGVTAWRFKLEGSIFRGAEPDEHRIDIELGKLDSWSARVWFTPTPDWSIQVSHGHLTRPEVLEPGDVVRTTASVAYNRPFHEGDWASSLIWGRNHEETGNSNSYLLESTVNFRDRNYAYTRLELCDKAGLLHENIFGKSAILTSPTASPVSELSLVHEDQLTDRSFRAGAFTFGGVRDLVAQPKVRVGIGTDVTFYRVPAGLKSTYGSPVSWHVFLRIRPGKMMH